MNKFKICAVVDKGNYRENNEDRILINSNVFDEVEFCDDLDDGIILAVADGVGGNNAGEIASKCLLDELSKSFKDIIYEKEKKIKEVVLAVYNKLQNIACENKEYKDMATTLSGVVISDDKVITFNIGDSRVYRFRNGILRQLTIDDSMVQMLAEYGMLDYQKKNEATNRNVITKYVNAEGKIFEPCIVEQNIVIKDGDIFCVVSDGIYDYIDIDLWEEILNSHGELMHKCHCIIENVKKRPNNDNISIILAEVYEDG